MASVVPLQPPTSLDPRLHTRPPGRPMSTWQLWRHLWTPDLRERSLWPHPRMLLWQPFARRSTFAARWSSTSLGLWRTWASLCAPAVRWATGLRQPQFHCLKVFSMSCAIHCWGVHASFPSSSRIFAGGTQNSNFTYSMHLWCYLKVLFGSLHLYFVDCANKRWRLESGSGILSKLSCTQA